MKTTQRLLLSLFFCTLIPKTHAATSSTPLLLSADHNALPQGKTITLSGTGLTGVTGARMLWSGMQFPTTFTEVSDTELQVVMPVVHQQIRDHYLLVEATNGSTIGLTEGMFEYSSGIAFSGVPMIVLPGATASISSPRNPIIYVKTGGVLELNGSCDTTVFAEDGAVLDFTGVSSAGMSSKFFYSPDTVIIGDIPLDLLGRTTAEQLTSIHPSYDLGTFTVGYPINVTTVGDGTVTVEPNDTYYRIYTTVQLTATPGSNSTFSGWSGSKISNDNALSVQVNSTVSLTATFSAGWLLNLYDIPGVDVTISPDIPVYSNGQSVAFSAAVDEGYEFLGWGGDLSGTALSNTLVMTTNMTVIPLLRKEGYDQLPQLTDADNFALPQGETITLSGTHLTDVTGARMLWTGMQFPTTFTEISDTELQVVMPVVHQDIRDHYLLVETTNGSTVGLTDSMFQYSNGVAFNSVSMVVLPGATATISDPRNPIIYVRTGGILKLNGSCHGAMVFAEDGAVLDFTGITESLLSKFFYSPATVILGEIPEDLLYGSSGEQLTSIHPSYDLGTFTVGYPINITLAGDGTVSAEPEQTYYPIGTTVQLTASPGSNSTFSGWSGSQGSSQNPLPVLVNSTVSLTATFSTGWLLNLYDIPGVNVTVSPDIPVYSNGQPVAFSATTDEGYEFLGWGGDLNGTAQSNTLTMTTNMAVIPVVRKEGYDQLPQLTDADYFALPQGETIALSGTNLTDVTGARMLWSSMQFQTTFTEVSDTELQVVMPVVHQQIREHYLLVETTNGSTVGLTEGMFEYSSGIAFNGVPLIVLPGATATISSPRNPIIYVKTGGVLELNGTCSSVTVFAEDGAVLDFTGIASVFSSCFFYSPDTVIIGEIPVDSIFGSTGEQLTSIHPSHDLGTFTVGYHLNLQIEGPGTVDVSPVKTYYNYGDKITFTAEPDPEAYFIRWIGPLSGHEPTGTVGVSGNINQIARFSSAPNYFTVWRLEHFTTEELQDMAVSAFDADPDRDGFSNAAEYAFGTDPRAKDGNGRNVKVKMEREDGEMKFYSVYKRPKTSLDIEYRTLISSDMLTWNFNGDDTDLVYSREVSVESVDELYEEVTIELFPEGDSPRTFFVKISAELFE